MRKSIIKSIAMLALMLVSVGAWAQDSGTTPYQGSTHTYQVNVENASNTLGWEICSGATWSDATKLPENDAVNAVVTDLTGVNADPSVVKITYGTALPAGDYTIRFKEEDASSCISYRTLKVTVGTNNYNLLVSNATDDCADIFADGNVLAGNLGSTIRTFTVTNGDSNVSPWTYTVNVTVADHSGGSNDASFTFTVDGNTHTSGDAITVSSGTTSTVVVTVDNTNVLKAAQDITVSVASTTANLVESDTSDNTGTSQIYKLPDTGDITAN